MVDLLASLAEKSLIQVDWGAKGEARYRFLETVRQYASEMLRDANELEARRDQHLRFMLEWVARVEPELTGPDQETWFRRLRIEHENVLAALAWCEHAEDGGLLGLRMAGSLWRFWWHDGHFTLGLASLQRALARDPAARIVPERAQALYAAAQMARGLGNWPLARDLFLQSLDVAQRLGDSVRIGRAYNGLGNTAEQLGDLDAAADYHRKSLAVSRQAESKRGVAVDLHNLGIGLLVKKDYVGAGRLYEEALAIFQEIGDLNGAEASVANLALIATRSGDFAAAVRYFQESFRLAGELSSGTETADSLESFAELAVEVGAPDLAALVLGTAAAVRETTGYAPSLDSRIAIDATAGKARSALGERRHALLDAEGRATPFDAAVRSVQEWLAARARGS
jgi:tetratricopeptide (TPR) repeat protein